MSKKYAIVVGSKEGEVSRDSNEKCMKQSSGSRKDIE